jgi:hypothetical protein
MYGISAIVGSAANAADDLAVRLHGFVDDDLAREHDNAYAVWHSYTVSRWLDLQAP